MNGLFLCYEQFDAKRPSGVDKKIMAQVRAFQKAGIGCDLFFLDENTSIQGGRDFLSMILRRLPFSNRDPAWVYSDSFGSVDFIYLRKPPYISWGMRKVLMNMKNNNPHARIVMEIPTFPYDSEYSPIRDFPFLLKDRYNRQRLAGLIDKIVYISDRDHNKVFSIPAIRVINGIDLSTISPRIPKIDDVIDICAVANFSKWHGYERLLYGVRDYYAGGGTRRILVHMVGDGPELSLYQRIASDPLIRERVVFYGRLGGDQLENIYNRSDFGACHMGLYKSNDSLSSGLKSREYLAKGLPMITGCPVDILGDKQHLFFLEYPSDASSIDIDRVISYYDRMHTNDNVITELLNNMRAYAEATISMDITMRPVTEYLQNSTQQ